MMRRACILVTSNAQRATTTRTPMLSLARDSAGAPLARKVRYFSAEPEQKGKTNPNESPSMVDSTLSSGFGAIQKSVDGVKSVSKKVAENDSVKQAIGTVDKTASKAAISGLETIEGASDKVKGAVEDVAAEKPSEVASGAVASGLDTIQKGVDNVNLAKERAMEIDAIKNSVNAVDSTLSGAAISGLEKVEHLSQQAQDKFEEVGGKDKREEYKERAANARDEASLKGLDKVEGVLDIAGEKVQNTKEVINEKMIEPAGSIYDNTLDLLSHKLQQAKINGDNKFESDGLSNHKEDINMREVQEDVGDTIIDLGKKIKETAGAEERAAEDEKL